MNKSYKIQSFKFFIDYQVNYNFEKIKKSLQNQKETGNYFSDSKRLKQAMQEEKESKTRSFFFSKTGGLYTSINNISNMDENKFENHFIVCGFFRNNIQIL